MLRRMFSSHLSMSETSSIAYLNTAQGNYKEIQYDGAKGESFCVDTYRGSEIEGTRINGKHDYIGCKFGRDWHRQTVQLL